MSCPNGAMEPNKNLEADDRSLIALTDLAVARPPVGALTIDVEDYFQVEAFAPIIDRSTWDSYPQRVVRNTDCLLDILAEAGATGTFFTLGWVAQRHPKL